AIGARLVLVSVPTHDGNLKALLAATADSAGVPYLPLDSALAPLGERAHFAPDGHLNAAGHQGAAAAIEALLVARRGFQPAYGLGPLPAAARERAAVPPEPRTWASRNASTRR